MDDDKELLNAIAAARPKAMGVVRAKDLLVSQKPKAVLFVPEGQDLDSDNLEVEVVGMNAAPMAAMVARRC